MHSPASRTERRPPLWIPAVVVALFGLGWLLLLAGHRSGQWIGRVVVYTSLDELYSEPILREFERRTSVRVDVVYDSEATKTVGLANRILFERRNPRADVFWNSEILHTIRLQAEGAFEAYSSPSAQDIPAEFRDPGGVWTGFAARARVIGAYKDVLTKQGYPPRGIEELVHARFRDRIGIASPFFGTTATHMAALCQALGKSQTVALLQKLKNHGLRVYPGNGPVADAVARGEILAGLTDTDDVAIRKQAGKPVFAIYPDAMGMGTLVIPNTVALVKGGPNPEFGRMLIDFLLSRQVEEKLARARGRQMPVRDLPVPEGDMTLSQIRPMKVDWSTLPRHFDEILPELKRLFMD